jgi:hypothetical protein
MANELCKTANKERLTLDNLIFDWRTIFKVKTCNKKRFYFTTLSRHRQKWGIRFCSIGFVVLTAVVMNAAIFWDIALCTSTPYANRRFGGNVSLHLQGRKSYEQEISVQKVATQRRDVAPKRRFI